MFHVERSVMTASQSVRLMTSQGMVLGMAQTPGVPGNDRHEASLMGDVDRHPWGPTEPDEMAVLRKRYAYDEASGTFSSHVGD